MLEKTVKSRQELIDAIDNIEMLGFPFQIAATPSGDTFQYRLWIGNEAAPTAEDRTPTGRKRRNFTEPMERKTYTEVAERSNALSEMLRSKRGSMSTQQVHAEMKNLGYDFKYQSTSSVIQTAMQSDRKIIKVGHGMYGYDRSELPL